MSDYENLKILLKSLLKCDTLEDVDALRGDFSGEKDFELAEIFTSILALKRENLFLKDLSKKQLAFNNAMKNIAKIIETQYELSYILPLIGELLDTFISNHLIYVFLKHNGKMKLAYPAACLDKTIPGKVNTIKLKDNYIIDENEKIGYFPLISENNLIGCLVTKSIDGNITSQEVCYLQQLSKQAATTISRANIYSEILKHATLDALTGFYNRRQLDERVKQEVSGAKRKKTPLCAIMVDIDYFKKVNDTWGHAAGDIVLKTVAKVMRSQLREYDIAARYGGEEFVILLPQTTKEEAIIVAERLRQTVEKKVVDISKVNSKNSQKTISVTISLGVGSFAPTENAEDFIMRVDKTLYNAKENGRNRVVA